MTTAEIARAFLVGEATVAQRISRAKRTIEQRDGSFPAPGEESLTDRMPTVLLVLYLIFNEGYTASGGANLHRVDLTAEAIRLTRQLHTQRPRRRRADRAARVAVHDQASTYEDTDWLEILGLYDLLQHVAPGPMLTLNRIAALAMVEGPQAALAELTLAREDKVLDAHYRADAVQAHLLEMVG